MAIKFMILVFFFEENSFQPMNQGTEWFAQMDFYRYQLDNTLVLDTNFYEAGYSGIISFTRDQTSTELCLLITIPGSATSGIDYIGLPDTVCMSIGVDSVAIPITKLEDGIAGQVRKLEMFKFFTPYHVSLPIL